MSGITTAHQNLLGHFDVASSIGGMKLALPLAHGSLRCQHHCARSGYHSELSGQNTEYLLSDIGIRNVVGSYKNPTPQLRLFSPGLCQAKRRSLYLR